MEAISFNSIPEGKLDEVIAEHFTQPYGFEPNLIMDADREEESKRIEAKLRIDSEIARVAIKNSGTIVCEDSNFLYIEH